MISYHKISNPVRLRKSIIDQVGGESYWYKKELKNEFKKKEKNIGMILRGKKSVILKCAFCNFEKNKILRIYFIEISVYFKVRS